MGIGSCCHPIGTNLRVAPQGSQGHVPELQAVLPWVTWQQLSGIDKRLAHHLVVAPTSPRVSLHVSLHAVGPRQLLSHHVLFQEDNEPSHRGIDSLSFRLRSKSHLLSEAPSLPYPTRHSTFGLVLVYIGVSKCLFNSLAPPTVLWARNKHSVRDGRCGHQDSSHPPPPWGSRG